MISQKEIDEMVDFYGLKKVIIGRFIEMFYDELCVAIYDSSNGTVSVWEEHKNGGGFDKDYRKIGTIKTVRELIGKLIESIKKEQKELRIKDIVSACEGFEV